MSDETDPAKLLQQQLVEFRELMAQQEHDIELEQKQADEIRAILDELVAKRRKHLDKIDVLKSEQRTVKYQLTEAERQFKIKQAEIERKKALEPHFEHPRLQYVLRLLEGHPRYNMLKQYQKEDLVFMLDRFLFPLKTKGVMNGNDTGLGKTAETAFLLWTMEAFDNEVKLGKVPAEVTGANAE